MSPLPLTPLLALFALPLLAPLTPPLLVPLSAPMAPAIQRPFAPPPPDAVWPLDPRPRIVHAYAPPAKPWLPGHRGIDLAGTPGQPVLSATPGTITYAGPVAGRSVVVVTHGHQRTTYEPVIPSLPTGTTVHPAQPIGRLSAAASHCAPTTCLHWGLLEGKTYLNPLSLLPAQPVRLLPTTPGTPAPARVTPRTPAPARVAPRTPGAPPLQAQHPSPLLPAQRPQPQPTCPPAYQPPQPPGYPGTTPHEPARPTTPPPQQSQPCPTLPTPQPPAPHRPPQAPTTLFPAPQPQPQPTCPPACQQPQPPTRAGSPTAQRQAPTNDHNPLPTVIVTLSALATLGATLLIRNH
ncbi:M23 family metallopeptidase [Kribbella lupini]|uniref:M23 family metallopeptidase n=1 Tax=Kribbella lupini TaxID=291602 RepID=UPI0031DBB6DC